MVGLVLVSHSRKLAESVRDLVLQMTAPGFPVAVAGGVGDNFDELGTDAVHIADVLQNLSCPEGALVLMDLGSAVLSAQTALELLDSPGKNRITLCPAPLVEGAIAAAVSSQAGCTLAEVAREAECGLAAKQQQLQDENSADSPLTDAPLPTAAPSHTAELELTIDNQHGLHARPAAALVQTASRFSSSIEVFNLTAGRGPVSARSLTSVALLQIRKGDRIKVVCSGDDCQNAVKAIGELASAGFGEPTQDAPAVTPEKVTPETGVRSFPGSDGIAVGPLAMLQTEDLSEDNEPANEPGAELAKLKAATKSVSDTLRRNEVHDASGSAGGAAILEAQALILGDPIVLTKLQSLIENGHRSAGQAWTQVTQDLAAQYEAMDDPYLRERAADVRDIERRVLRQLKGNESQLPIRLPHPAILFTEELLPSEAAACDPATVLGVIAAKGSATSHSAIILRTLGIPMVVGAVDIGNVASGTPIAMDGATGEVWVDPDAQTIARLEKSKQTQLQLRRQAEMARSLPGITLDGTRIEVLANVGNAEDAKAAAGNAADGVGLLRTEFLFVARREAPSEDQQVQALREIYSSIAKPIIVRTLDVGADKPLAFLPQPQEHNPYLGARGIRLSLRSPELFLTHLRAILRSGVGHEIWLMFPMISLLQEVQQALRLLEQAHQQLQTQEIPHAWPIKRGIMIEVPSAALSSEHLAEHLDFFSIGTNDLTQYTMAAERGNAAVAELQDALQPAVLRLVKFVVEGAGKRNRHVSLCGDAASDPLAAAVFAGLGVRSLSVRPNQVAEIKALFRELQFHELQETANRALLCQEAGAVRNLIRHYLSDVSNSRRDSVVASAD
ncbi:MAG: phosphoenolpyruvate--protein phosphotransferase [Candidatus Korobacteraceae bacterium]